MLLNTFITFLILNIVVASFQKFYLLFGNVIFFHICILKLLFYLFKLSNIVNSQSVSNYLLSKILQIYVNCLWYFFFIMPCFLTCSVLLECEWLIFLGTLSEKSLKPGIKEVLPERYTFDSSSNLGCTHSLRPL